MPGQDFTRARKRVMRIPLREEVATIRLLVVLALISLVFFLNWFFKPEHIGVSWLYWLLVFAMLYKLLRWLHEWYHYVSVSYPPVQASAKKESWRVDMLTTFCAGEPYEMVEETLRAMVAVRYPHTTYLCDEADDSRLRRFCEKMGIVHVTREKKINAKAGNINNALKRATGEIAVVLDPDHIPTPDFLDHVLPYFNDEKIGFVQVVQSYGNKNESFVARGAAEQTYQFYGPLMMGMNSYGTTQAIGANCTFRRAALDSIGGHAAGLSEDMHTAMQLHAKGWKSVYLPMVLTIGLAPSSLSAFFQQQLKWSRGTFELLATSYIRLFSKFSWRHRFHYFTIVLYFLSGLITLLDISIPVIALFTAQPVWKIDLSDFLLMFAPVFILSVLIRSYSQRWLPKKEERGFHLKGGILQMGTWWIYLTGLVCTILRVKIPYIPTPKDNEARNDFRLSIPNLAAALISLAAIPVGLSLDWSPFSIFMAGFALINAILLIWISVMAQQKMVKFVKQSLARVVTESNTRARMRAFWNRLHDSSLTFMRRWALFPGIAVFAFSLASEIQLELMDPVYRLEDLESPTVKNHGGFYTGIYIPEIEKKNSFQKLDATEKQLNTRFDIVSVYMAWGPESGADFPDTLLKKIAARNAIPLVTMEPWTWPFPEYRSHPELCCEKKVLSYISAGYFNKYLTEYALKFKAVNGPVMLRFAHEFDNPAYPWSESGGNTPEDFIRAWRYMVNHFDSLGVGNVVWVWNPWEEEGLEKYYPGDEYVDWIGVTCLNYGKAASNNRWYDLDALYRPFSGKIKKYNKPVLLTEFGSTTFGGNQSVWLDRAFQLIETEFTEVKGVVFFYSDNDPHWGFTAWRPEGGDSTINWTFTSALSGQTVRTHLNRKPFNSHPFHQSDVSWSKTVYRDNSAKKYISGSTGNFQLLVDARPFYIKGVVYNGGTDWRDGEIPLTRSKLEEDFSSIREMGANTIRRYDPGIYDHNILNVAAEKELKVLYGFWFEQGVDYSKDEKVLKEYEEKVISAVKRYRGHDAILGWSIGNEVWGLSKKYYGQPYLFKVRRKYLEFIEHLARRIHELDPGHPVFIAEEHTSKLPAAVEDFNRYAPSVDVFGINSYYYKHISKLPGIMKTFGANRPYLISEFGPEGYWQPDFTKADSYGAVLEDGGLRKAHLYERRWLDQIEPYKGSNLGGIAYCWTDRLEGTSTWFGLTDSKGRKKPAYCSLKQVWTGQPCEIRINEVYIFSPEDAIDPGKSYAFFAVTEDSKSKDLKYEWYLCKDEFVIMKSGVKTEDGGRMARVVIPDEKSAYRLYVNVSDENGFCNSASLPLPAFRK